MFGGIAIAGDGGVPPDEPDGVLGYCRLVLLTDPGGEGGLIGAGVLGGGARLLLKEGCPPLLSELCVPKAGLAGVRLLVAPNPPLDCVLNDAALAFD